MRLALTTEQQRQLSAWMRHDGQLLARVHRLPYDGGNAETSGTLQLLFVSIPHDRLETVRAAIAGTLTTRPKRKAK